MHIVDSARNLNVGRMVWIEVAVKIKIEIEQQTEIVLPRGNSSKVG